MAVILTRFKPMILAQLQKDLFIKSFCLYSALLLSSCGGAGKTLVPVDHPPVTRANSSLDWDWTVQAKAYCDNHQNEAVTGGQFEILRPQDSEFTYSSEHFVLRWNSGDGVNISQTTITNALNTLESVWDFYIDTLHFPEPYWDTSTKYKVSVNVSNQGYASGAGTGERDPEMWVHYDALAHVGTLAHEFAHTLQFTTRSMRNSEFVGWLWESHANWMAHQFNPADVQCTEALVNAPHIYYGSTRNRYCNWQFFEFLKDNSCAEFVNDALWKNGIKPENPAHRSIDPFTNLANNAFWTTEELNDIFADWALHNVHWDYEQNGLTYRQRYGSYSDETGARRTRLTRLIPTGVDNQYAVPDYWAPQRWGYNVVQLKAEPGSNVISLDFEGLVQDSPAVSNFPSGFQLQPSQPANPNSSWRWSVVVTDANNKARYSEIQRGNSSSLKVELQPGDRSVWLVVMATPDSLHKIFWDQIYYSIYRYPWRITIEGATPQLFADHYSGGIRGSAHSNGGGFVAATAQVSSSVFVGPNAKVLENARVTGFAEIQDYAIVKGSAQISGDAVVKGYALVAGSAQISGNAVVEDHAAVTGGRVQEFAQIGALSRIEGQNTLISGNAVVRTTMNAISGRTVSGSAQLYGDMELNTSVNKGVFYGYVNESIAADPAYGADRSGPESEITLSF